jgi:lipopolysaccharide export system protein LptC
LNATNDSALRPVDERVAVRRLLLPWYRRAVDAVSHYLPLVLMALLALGTWSLVKNTPVFEGEKPAVALSHVPDYTMQNFTAQRFAKDGALALEMQGDTLRHYPDTDTLEIDNAHIRSITPEGRVTTASAEMAVSNGDGSEVQLTGKAHVLREAYSRNGVNEAPVDFRSEFLHAFLRTERVISHLPVTITREGAQVRGDSMEYDNLTREARFKGRVHAVFAQTGASSRAAPASENR